VTLGVTRGEIAVDLPVLLMTFADFPSLPRATVNYVVKANVWVDGYFAGAAEQRRRV